VAVVVAHPGDRGAAAVAEVLARRHGPEAVLAVTVEHLALAARWEHEVAGGVARTRIRLPGGRVLEPHHRTAVINRIRHVPAPAFPDARDREYAVAEIAALLLSWLAGLPGPVVNPPSPRAWTTPAHSAVAVRAAAAAAGVPAGGLRLATSGRRHPRPGWLAAGLDGGGPLGPAVPAGDRPVRLAEPAARTTAVLVAGPRVLGAPSPAWEDRCRRLVAGLGLLLATVTLAGDPWRVEAADPFPPLDGPGHAEAAADLLG
jgi:hypothetical protein